MIHKMTILLKLMANYYFKIFLQRLLILINPQKTGL